MKPATVTCLMPIYNEGKTFLPNLKCVLKNTFINEVIAINDGSIDNTRDILSKLSHPKLKIITLPKNIGKAGAIAEGMKHNHSNITLLLDGDLINLTNQNLLNLIKPTMTEQQTVTIALLKNAPLIARILRINPVSGQRAIPTKLLQQIKPVRGYEFEIALNQVLLESKIKIESISWPNVTHLTKTQKHNFWKGLSLDLNMNFQILKTFGFINLLSQYWKLFHAI